LGRIAAADTGNERAAKKAAAPDSRKMPAGDIGREPGARAAEALLLDMLEADESTR
jgi:hypothetical protein